MASRTEGNVRVKHDVNEVAQVVEDQLDVLAREGAQRILTEAMEAGARGYLVKPFQPPQLLAVAERALDAE